VIVGQAVAVAFGVVVIVSVLVSALETVVLPRKGFTRIARCVFALADRLLVHRWRSAHREAELRALYAPIALVSLPLVWMLSVALGFSLIFWGIGAGSASHSFELSGSSLTTLGFSAPKGTARIWLSFVEAIIGLGLVALLIGYLPTIYSAHSGREKGINLLRPMSGTPPSAVTLLQNLHRTGGLDSQDVWRTGADWLLNVDQSHSAFPALCYFPDSSPHQSWVASLGVLLDAATLLLSPSQYRVDDHPPRQLAGPLLALAYGVPALGRIASAVGLPVVAPALPAELLLRSGPPPEISIHRDEYEAALRDLDGIVSVPAEHLDRSWSRFAWLRSGYDQDLRGLAGLTLAFSAPWTTDRPATVGRPRILSGRSLAVSWSPGVRHHATGPLTAPEADTPESHPPRQQP
jgi:hypothetical protein